MSAVLTVVVYAVLAVVVVAALVAVAVLLLPGTEQLTPAPPDRTPWALPAERSMTGPDVGRLRLPVTLRGYRFAETDAVLDRLGEEIAHRDAVIASLRSELDGRAGEPQVGAEPAGAEPVEPLADPAVVDPAVVDPEPVGAEPVEPPADPAVELGETPEETEHETGPDVDTTTHAQPEVEALEPRVVAFDDEPLDLEPPDGPAPRS